jgi:hypothetical protein
LGQDREEAVKDLAKYVVLEDDAMVRGVKHLLVAMAGLERFMSYVESSGKAATKSIKDYKQQQEI